ncbi:unnamed protein product, partial [Discosporangium mesarthrocarpum]
MIIIGLTTTVRETKVSNTDKKMATVHCVGSLGNDVPLAVFYTKLSTGHFLPLHCNHKVTEAEIRLSMAQLPVQSMMFDAACLASKAGAEQAIVSDANEVFINNVLSHHGLNPLFNQGVHTNGGAFTEDGRLDVHPYCPVDAPHGCNLCPPNMCKGSIVDGLLRGSSGKAERIFDTVIYVGDGGGDFCPTLRLRERDLVLARGGGTSGKKYGLYQRIQKRAVSLGMSSASKELGYWPQSC